MAGIAAIAVNRIYYTEDLQIGLQEIFYATIDTSPINMLTISCLRSADYISSQIITGYAYYCNIRTNHMELCL
jgi:hypothetical protein